MTFPLVSVISPLVYVVSLLLFKDSTLSISSFSIYLIFVSSPDFHSVLLGSRLNVPGIMGSHPFSFERFGLKDEF